MNGRISIQSSVLCDDGANDTSVPAFQQELKLAGVTRNKRVRHMSSFAINQRKLLLFMVMCLIFATAIPMIVLAAS